MAFHQKPNGTVCVREGNTSVGEDFFETLTLHFVRGMRLFNHRLLFNHILLLLRSGSDMLCGCCCFCLHPIRPTLPRREDIPPAILGLEVFYGVTLRFALVDFVVRRR